MEYYVDVKEDIGKKKIRHKRRHEWLELMCESVASSSEDDDTGDNIEEDITEDSRPIGRH